MVAVMVAIPVVILRATMIAIVVAVAIPVADLAMLALALSRTLFVAIGVRRERQTTGEQGRSQEHDDELFPMTEHDVLLCLRSRA
jgi:hypothetical protein